MPLPPLFFSYEPVSELEGEHPAWTRSVQWQVCYLQKSRWEPVRVQLTKFYFLIRFDKHSNTICSVFALAFYTPYFFISSRFPGAICLFFPQAHKVCQAPPSPGSYFPRRLRHSYVWPFHCHCCCVDKYHLTFKVTDIRTLQSVTLPHRCLSPFRYHLPLRSQILDRVIASHRSLAINLSHRCSDSWLCEAEKNAISYKKNQPNCPWLVFFSVE